jgi:hypothetical protein
MVAGLLAGMGTNATAGPAESCRSKQIAAAGKVCATVFKKCYATRAKSGLPVDMICMGDALVALTAALDKAEASGMCDHSMIDLSIWDRLQDLGNDVADGQLAYRTGGMCAAKKLKAVAKECSAFTKCYAIAAKASATFTPDAACLGAASESFAQSVAKIEGATTCVPAGNAGEVGALVDDGVADVSTMFTSGPPD